MLNKWFNGWSRASQHEQAALELLAHELGLAARALDIAAECMKRQTVTPSLTNQTRAAATRAHQVIDELNQMVRG